MHSEGTKGQQIYLEVTLQIPKQGLKDIDRHLMFKALEYALQRSSPCLCGECESWIDKAKGLIKEAPRILESSFNGTAKTVPNHQKDT